MADSVTMTRTREEIDRLVDTETGEIKDRPRQTRLAGMDKDYEPMRDYRVQVTVVTEAFVSTRGVEAAETEGLQDIEAGEGMVVKRSVSVTYVRPK